MPFEPLFTQLYNLLKETQEDLNNKNLTKSHNINIKSQLDNLVFLLEDTEQEDIDELNRILEDE